MSPEEKYNNNLQCYYCNSLRIKWKEVSNAKCVCEADIHFKKKCIDCNQETFIHRVRGGDKNPLNEEELRRQFQSAKEHLIGG